MNLRIYPAQEPDHAHVQRVVVHRREAILRHHQVDAHESRISRSRLEAQQRLREHLLLGKAAQHLAKVADLDAARRSRIRLPAVLSLRAQRFGLVQAGLGDSHIAPQSSCEQRLAQLSEVLAPADFFSDRRCMTEIRRVHQFQVLFILCCRASRHLVNPRADVPVIRTAEFRKRIEKMIVPGYARRRHKSSHRKRIHQRVVQFLILERSLSGNLALAARILLDSAAGRRWRLRKRQLRNFHAQMILRPRTDPRFRVHRSAQVIVQVAALRHLEQKLAKLQRIFSCDFEVGFRALLQTCRCGRGSRRFGLTSSRPRERKRRNENAA